MNIEKKLIHLEKQLELERQKSFAMLSVVVSKLGIAVADFGNIEAAIAPIEYYKSNSGDDGVILAFGGNAQRLGMPAPEFSRVLTGRNKSVAFFKDHYQAWYHRGLVGLSTDVPTTIDVINRLNVNWKSSKFVGSSSGGYAAILFGCKCGATDVVAFGPQTIISEKEVNLFKSQDTRMSDVLHKKNRDYFDLVSIVECHPNTNIHIHYSLRHEADRIAAERLKHLGNVELIPYDWDDHNVAKYLRDLGELETALAPLL